MNPFLKNTPIEVIEVNENWEMSMKLPMSNNESTIRTSMPRKYYVDKHKSVSIFKVKELAPLIYNLNNSAKSIFFYILFNLKDKDIIRLDYKEIIKELDISDKTYYHSLNSLIDADIITKKYSKEYWINPWYFYPGGRINKVRKEYGENAVNIVGKVSKNK